jgi:epoxide hydrolase 4
MILIHGFPDFWFGWRNQLKEFSQDYYVVALDQRGFGDSDKPEKLSDYNVNELVEDIYQLGKKLGEKLPCIFKTKFMMLILFKF